MAVAENLARAIPRTGPEIGGSAVGIGLPVALRETVDVDGGEPVSLIGDPNSLVGKWTRPSVAWGVGVGGLTGLLWWLNMGGDEALQDFYFAHTVTAVPTGLGSLLFPKAGTGMGDTAVSALRRATEERDNNIRTSNTTDGQTPTSDSGDGDFEPSDGGMAEAQ